jgi:hypothetical protein
MVAVTTLLAKEHGGPKNCFPLLFDPFFSSSVEPVARRECNELSYFRR